MHRSKRIFAGDRILAVDSVTFDKQTTVASLQKALIGSDERGSTVAITVQHPPTALGVKRLAPSEADWTLGKVETVVLERVPATQVAHKSQMYECFMQMLDRAREVPDKLQQDALVSLAEEAQDLWQRTLLEMQVAYCLLETLSPLSLSLSLSLLSLSLCSLSLSLSLEEPVFHVLDFLTRH